SFANAGRTDMDLAALAVVAQSDGKLLIARSGIRRLNADGSMDQSFHAAATPGAAIIVGGDGNPIVAATLGAPDVGFELVRLKRDDAPAALLTLRTSTISSGNFTTLKLDMTYRDEDKVNVGSLDDKDMQIRLPDGSTRKARLVSVNKPTNGRVRHAIY